MTELRAVLASLVEAEARFVVVGGVALMLHGSSYLTEDLDLAYERSLENARRVVEALRRFAPRPRGLPPSLPFVFDAQAVFSTRVLTLETDVGDVDLLGEIAGVGHYSAIEAAADKFTYAGMVIRVLSIDALIASKRAAGRRKDEAGLIELEAIQEARRLAQQRPQ